MIRRLALIVIAVCLAGSSAVRAQELSQAEKDKALQYLESTKKGVEEATKGLSAAQWNFKPAPDRWSIAEVMEHIAATEDTLRGMVTEQVLKAPPAPDRDVKQIDEMVMTRIPDRSHKAQAPDALRPTNRFGSPDAGCKGGWLRVDFVHRRPQRATHKANAGSKSGSELSEAVTGLCGGRFRAARPDRAATTYL